MEVEHTKSSKVGIHVLEVIVSQFRLLFPHTHTHTHTDTLASIASLKPLLGGGAMSYSFRRVTPFWTSSTNFTQSAWVLKCDLMLYLAKDDSST
jgi:hypothetical protein